MKLCLAVAIVTGLVPMGTALAADGRWPGLESAWEAASTLRLVQSAPQPDLSSPQVSGLAAMLVAEAQAAGYPFHPAQIRRIIIETSKQGVVDGPAAHAELKRRIADFSTDLAISVMIASPDVDADLNAFLSAVPAGFKNVVFVGFPASPAIEERSAKLRASGRNIKMFSHPLEMPSYFSYFIPGGVFVSAEDVLKNRGEIEQLMRAISPMVIPGEMLKEMEKRQVNTIILIYRDPSQLPPAEGEDNDD
ncbi:MAG: hypothetical protein HY549_03890, partial [Elusimicrobia bacterium]|nr:hypothetical protein [Elusimicrobiota bacterium]